MKGRRTERGGGFKERGYKVCVGVGDGDGTGWDGWKGSGR